MKKICIVSNENIGKNNVIFKPIEGLSELLKFEEAYITLKNLFKQAGYDLQTSDINKPKDCCAVIHISSLTKYQDIDPSKSYLIRNESKIIAPHEWEENYLSNFKKIFTYSDDTLSSDKFIRLKLPKNPFKVIKTGLEHKDKFCCAVYSNKHSNLPNELYTERNEFIRWFEKNHPELFDLYGYNWELGEHKEYPFLPKILKKRKFFKKIFNPQFPSFKGQVEDKYGLLEQYKFSLAYENVKDVSGYISEKIFDCFNAGTIPIYLGANNILDYIPQNCFIDKRDFSSLEELFYFMKNMPDDEYLQYQKNIIDYINSEKAEKFSPQQYAETIFESILNDIKNNEKI